jgi:NAD(P)-dependent dehydrogenase (short-subunit alcohol dehydrogenase family)
MNRVLVIGGYGGFGARLARRLAGDGWQVLVAGRNAAKARAMAAALSNAEGVMFDRSGDCAAQLAVLKPDLVIDAAGPFQDADYALAQACIAAGCPYLDLADGRRFVCGIGVLDQAARAAGVAVVSGASSLPALSGAVIRHLGAGMDRFERIDMAISATTRASSGLSVVRAALSYAGQPVALWRAGQWQDHAGWSLSRRIRFAVPGQPDLLRHVALADVPDLELLPRELPGQPATTFRGGSEFSLQMLALGALGWVVRRGWLRSAEPLARWLAPLQQASARLGGSRSAMVVEIAGTSGGELTLRRWTLIARRGEGQEIPTLPAQLLARRVLAGSLKPGARHAGNELELADFEPLFADLAIDHAMQQEEPQMPYRQVMGSRFADLAEPVRQMHQPLGLTRARGTASVERGTSLVARLMGQIMGFPPAGSYRCEVLFEPENGREVWTRSFGPHRFSSEMSAARSGLLVERFGPLRFHFALEVTKEGGLVMLLRRWTVLGLPMPLALGPRITAGETAEGDAFRFDVAVVMPLLGSIVHYRGLLRLDEPSA